MSVVELTLLARPLELSMSTRGEFEIGISATNRGTTTIDPALYRTRLLINDEDSLPFSDAIGNGVREREWFELAPGETVSMSWPSMGEIFFPVPGTYTLKLNLGGVESEPVAIRVGGQ